MTNEEAKKMLKAKLECLKRETSGTDFDCNQCNCDECPLNYEQGNMGEQKEALDIGIKSIKALDKLNSIIVDQLDKSDDQKECMTLRWVLDKMAEVRG